MSRPENLTIFIVDDDEVDRRGLIRVMRKDGIQNPVEVATDGVNALEMLRNHHDRKPDWPFIVLLDINMPRMDGHQFLGELRADPVLSATTVFVLTTSDDERDIVAAWSQHIAGYLVKRSSAGGVSAVVALIKAYGEAVRFPKVGPDLSGR